MLYTKTTPLAPVLTPEEEKRLARCYRETGSRAARQRLIVGNLRFVIRIARQYGGYGLPLEDRVQEGTVGLIEAVDRFDPDRGVRLVTYAVWRIRLRVHQLAMRDHSMVRLGTTASQRTLFFRLRSARESALRAGLTEPSDVANHVARNVGVSTRDVVEMSVRLLSRDVELDAPSPSVATRRPSRHTLPDPAAGPEANVLLSETQRLVQAAARRARSRMNPNESYVLDHRLLAAEPASLQWIGDRLGFTRERARQIEVSAKRKLRATLLRCGVRQAG